MNQVKILLRSGSELNYITDKKFGEKGFDLALDGTQYIVWEDCTEAIIVTPAKQCTHCGKYYANPDTIHQLTCGLTNVSYPVCPFCHEPV